MRSKGERWHSALVAVALTGAALTLGACGDGGSSGGVAAIDDAVSTSTTAESAATSPKDREAALLKAAQCMRDNGVKDFPDPVVDSSGSARPGALGSVLNRNDPSVRAAFEKCGDAFQAARPQFTPEEQQTRQDALLAFAKCMRANGVNVPDPTFGPQGAGGGQPRGPFGGLNPNTPAFAKARTACQDTLSEVLPGGGPGFGGGRGGPGSGAPPAVAPPAAAGTQ